MSAFCKLFVLDPFSRGYDKGWKHKYQGSSLSSRSIWECQRLPSEDNGSMACPLCCTAAPATHNVKANEDSVLSLAPTAHLPLQRKEGLKTKVCCPSVDTTEAAQYRRARLSSRRFRRLRSLLATLLDCPLSSHSLPHLNSAPLKQTSDWAPFLMPWPQQRRCSSFPFLLSERSSQSQMPLTSLWLRNICSLTENLGI